MSPAYAILLLVVLQRLAELAYARHNTARLLARGGREAGAGHYPLFVLLHGAWLATLALRLDPEAAVSWSLVLAFVVLQAGRLWVIVSLGPLWTTRIITLPDAPLVRRGPYRLLRHPNYLIVALEIPLLPLAFGDWPSAVVFAILNLALLWWRMKVEDRVLDERREALS